MSKPFIAPFDAEFLRTRVAYDSESGEFTSRIGSPKVLGFKNWAGYVEIDLCQRTFKAHRLAWLYMTGEWPSRTIDHANRVRSDNRFKNLRLASPSEQAANSIRQSSRGLKGAKRTRNKTPGWEANIRVSGKRKYLGVFRSELLAHCAYLEAARFHYGDFVPHVFKAA